MNRFRNAFFFGASVLAACAGAQYQLQPFPTWFKPQPQPQVIIPRGPHRDSPFNLPPAQVQTPLGALLRGNGFPLAIRPSEIPPDYIAAKIVTDAPSASSGGGLFDMIMSPMMMMMGSLGGGQSQGDSAMMAAIGAMDLSWSRGDTTTINGVVFLVTYKPSLELADMGLMDKRTSFADTLLRLTLVRADSIRVVTPHPDMTRADFLRLMMTPFPPKPAKSDKG